jgi:F-type H+-transporting ATPase subunit delta
MAPPPLESAEGSPVSDTAPISDIAGRYAAALFELADESGALETVEGHLAALDAALRDSADLRALIGSPLYSREQQASAMSAVMAAMDVGAPTSNFVGLMASKRRLFLLPDAIRAFNRLLAKKRGVVSAEIRAAAPLSDAQRADLERTLREATGADVAMNVIVDEALIGGLVVKVGSRMVDTSIRSALSRLQTAMKEVGV